MRISLAPGRRRPLSRQTAWGCLTTNLALPGFGSLAAGRACGYAQAALALGGTGLTVAFGVRFILWLMANRARLGGSQADPWAAALEVWLALRWAALGIALFALGWLWALATSLGLLRAARKQNSAHTPPPLR